MQHALLNKNFGEVQTVIVLGAGRGGTSVVAGCLRGLGICMGNAHAFKHEWTPIVRPTPDGQVDLSATCEQIEKMNREHKVWGWKSPRDAFVLEQVFPFLRNPGLIIVTRAPSEIAFSARKHQDVPFEIAFYETGAVYQMIADRLRYWPWPILCVAYRGLLDKPTEFVDLLISFLRIKPAPADRQRAISFIDPEANTYRQFELDPNVPPGIPQQDLEDDAQIAAASVIDRYSRQYADDFAGMLQETRGALHLLSVRNGRAVTEVYGKVRAFLANFSVEDLRGFGLASIAPGSTTLGGDLSETESANRIARLCDGLESVVRETRERVGENDSLTTSHYSDLSRVHQLLKILIRIRLELQRALHFSGNHDAASEDASLQGV